MWKQMRSRLIFNSIADIYSFLDPQLQRSFRPAVRQMEREVSLSGKSVLDLGTGTGVWAGLLADKADRVLGLDNADRMLQKAQKRYNTKSNLEFTKGDALSLSLYPDKSFDLVTSSFVLHGFNKEKRQLILEEMKRLARSWIVIHDYGYERAHWFALFLEILEASDYFHFYRNFQRELTETFPGSYSKRVRRGLALYFIPVKTS